MRLRNVPEPTHETITRLEYRPGETFIIDVTPGKVVNGEFIPAKNRQPEAVLIRGSELIDIESNPDIANALTVIMNHAWNRVDAKQAEEE